MDLTGATVVFPECSRCRTLDLYDATSTRPWYIADLGGWLQAYRLSLGWAGVPAEGRLCQGCSQEAQAAAWVELRMTCAWGGSCERCRSFYESWGGP